MTGRGNQLFSHLHSGGMLLCDSRASVELDVVDVVVASVMVERILKVFKELAQRKVGLNAQISIESQLSLHMPVSSWFTSY